MKKILFLILLLASVSASAQIKRFKSDVLTADDTTTGTTLIASHLSFTMDSTRAADTSQVWLIDGCIFTGSSSAAGIALGFALKTNDTAQIAFIGTDSTVLQVKTNEISADSTASISWNNANAQTGKVFIHGTLVTAKGGATKTWTLLFKKLTSGTATLRRKSWITATRIQ